MLEKKKEHLGDSVYAEMLDDGTIKLTTEDGWATHNTIFLEPQVMAALVGFHRRHTETWEVRS